MDYYVLNTTGDSVDYHGPYFSDSKKGALEDFFEDQDWNIGSFTFSDSGLSDSDAYDINGNRIDLSNLSLIPSGMFDLAESLLDTGDHHGTFS